MTIKRYLLQLCLPGMLLLAASTDRVAAQVLFFDGFQEFANGTDLTGTNYTPYFGPATASVATSIQNGSPTVTVSNFLGSTWAFFDNSAPTNQNQYTGILASVQTNQPLQVTWNLWIQATNTGPGRFQLFVPVSDTNANDNPPIFFTDSGSIVALTNGMSVQVPVGNWGSLAGTVMTNSLVLDYPDGTFSYSLNGQTLATLPLGPYFTNVVGAIDFTSFERSAGSLGNRFAIANVEIKAFSPSNNFSFITSNNTITITGYTGTNTTEIIPSTINGLPVTSIGSYAFENETSLMSVTIPNSVASIGPYAFFGSGLTGVTIGSNVTNIGIWAFAFCNSLTNVMIPGSVTGIGGAALAQDYSLNTVYFLGNAPIADSTLFGGDYVRVYYVPGTTGWTNTFGGMPVAAWSQPKPMILGSDYGMGINSNGFDFIVSWAGSRALVVEACTNLANPLWIPLATNTLSNGFFYFNDPQWTNYPSRFYRITVTNAFASFTASTTNGNAPLAVQFNSPNIDNLGNPITNWNWDFGDGTTSAAQNPFHIYANGGFFHPKFAATNNRGGAVRSFGPPIAAFSLLTTTNNGGIIITGFAGNLASTLTIPGTVNSLPVTGIGASAFSGCVNLNHATIPDTVTTMGDDAFQGCTGLTNVMMGTNVVSIGNGAFSYCYRLTGITIPNSVASIGDYAFNACGSLTNVAIGNNVTNIGSFAFAFCSGLAGITIPNSVTRIGANAFEYCSGLTSITIPDNVTSIGDFAFGSCAGLNSLTIGNGVTNIGNLAFTFCTNLTSITIPGNVTGIGNSAFYSCSGLASATIGSGNIGDFVFGSCGRLNNVMIGNSVTDIGNFAFASCTGLTSISIPNRITGIGANAFDSCSNLANVMIGAGNIGDYAFSSCGILSSVVLGNGVANIGVGAFAGCNSLTSVTIPGSVTDIGGGAFSSCDQLINVTLGSGVSSIGSGVFSDDDNLQATYFQGNPPTLADGGLFYGANAAPAKIYYLPGAAGWSPQVQTSDGSFGVKSNQFGFNISGNNRLSVIVEACTNLVNPFWSPVATNLGSSYYSDSQWMNYPVRFYRLQSPSFAGLPVLLWNPTIQTKDGRFGVQSNQFSFTITGTTSIPVVVEACTNLANPTWTPLLSGTLTNGSLYFSDPAWANYPGRFYRISSQ